MVRHRGLLGVGVLLGLLVPVVAGRADETAAVKMVENLGGYVEVDAKRPGKPVVAVILTTTPFTDAGLKELKELKSLQTLYLDSTKVTDAGLKELKVLKSLQTLYLDDSKVTDEGKADLRKALPKLSIRG